MKTEKIFTMSSANIKYGTGAIMEAGIDMKALGATRVMVVTDKRVAELESVALVMKSLKKEGIETVLFSQVRIEPTDSSLLEAIEFACEGGFDGFIGIGGGSSMDTAKAANLYSTYPADFLDYVNAPIGKGKQVPGPIKPMVCIPTTAGTGSETTGVVIFDLEEMRAKTGIAHRYLRPDVGIIDPNTTSTLPTLAAASTGFDVLVHALESYTNLPYNKREAPVHPSLRPAYQGSNPIADVWAVKAIQIVSKYIIRAVKDNSDLEARNNMSMAATIAGIGFGNAGLHLPHGMSYPVSGMVRNYLPEGYPTESPIIPHGIAVTLNAPAALRFTSAARPSRHLEAARFMGVSEKILKEKDPGDALADALINLMQKTGMPNGLAAVGYIVKDIDKLVEGTLPQHRVTKLCPRPFTADDLKTIFQNSMKLW